MAKAVILDVLESTIGRYVLNLDTNSLNVAVWSGKIELQNLKLNVEAVNRKLAQKAAESPNLAIPFRVVDGSFQSIKLEVPWTRLTSRPVVFRAEGLNVMLEPFDHLTPVTEADGTSSTVLDVRETDEPKKKKKKNPRIKSLKYAEEERLRFNAMKKLSMLDLDTSSAADDEKDSSSASFGARLARRIIENLQFEIEGVHLSVQGDGFSVGVQLDQLSLVTTDEMGNRTFIDRVSSSKERSFLYKALAIHGFGIYCNELKDQMNITSPSYILAPLSFDAKLRQSDCPKCVEFPKYLLSSQLEIVSIILTRKQLEIFHGISTHLSLQLNARRPLFPQYRPEGTISRDTAKLWWKYAVRCVGRLNRRRSWTEYFLAFQKRKQYIQLYKRSMYSSTCNWLNPLTTDEISQLELLDMDRSISVEGIMSWRNLTDAQVELEQKKRKEVKAELKAQSKKKSMMSSIFGKKGNKAKNKGGGPLSESDSMTSEDISPIDLTAEELKELESMAMAGTNGLEAQLSSDSKLCDVVFKLGAFKVDLITFDNCPLAALEMGTTAVTFLANADGSFSCEFFLTSLNLHDKVTIGSLFPIVVRSLQKSSKLSSMNNAMEIRFQKDKSGDQSLIFKMVAYEIVPSSVLIKEAQKFFTFSNYRGRVGSSYLQNPILQTSTTSGDADLFYDAYYGSIMNDSMDITDSKPVNNANTVAGNVRLFGTNKMLAAALSDAWENKKERKTKWSVELVINAPIFVLPKSSTDPLSSVLAFDLGNFHFMYGNVEASESVLNWYETQSVEALVDNNSFDFCRFEMQHLSFVIGTAGNRDWDMSKVRDIEKRPISSETIIEPISFSISVGIANPSTKNYRTRSCLFGVLPSITLRLSYSQISRILTVLACWIEVVDSLNSNDKGILIMDKNNAGSHEFVRNSPQVLTNENSERPMEVDTIVDTTYINFKLNKLSLIVCSEEDESVEAHLVSAEASHTQRSDMSSVTNVKMGFFWIVDKLHYPQMPRRERFLVRSSLPKTVRYLETQIQGESYLMQELDTFGVSRASEIENNALADITVSSGVVLNDSVDPRLNLTTSETHKGIMVVAKFQSLFIFWNPIAVRSLILFQTKITDLAGRLFGKADAVTNKNDQFQGSVEIRKRGHSSDLVPRGNVKPSRLETAKLFVLQAEMKSFEITLNSARDDLPLYMAKMSGTKLSYQSLLGSSEAIVNVVVGDIRLEIPTDGKTLLNYCVILGLSPGQSSSLLSAVYYKGRELIKLDSTLPCDEKVEAVMTMKLSPMRLVYIQAQIMTLIEYISQGIVGAITQENPSGPIKATENAKSGESIFLINAYGFDIVSPEAAYSKSHFKIHCADFDVQFRLLSRPGSGRADIHLRNVLMESDQEPLVSIPIQVNINLLLGPLDANNEDEKALTLNLEISKVSFTMTRDHYVQLLLMADKNIGEDDPFLRHADFGTAVTSKGISSKNNLTHGGVQAVTVQRRLYINCRSEAVLLDICGSSVTDPLLTIAVLETVVNVQLVPDQNLIRLFVVMNDVTCEDRRLVAFNRPFRYIVKQVTDNLKRDVFNLEYEKSKISGDTKINLIVGSPQIAVVPDAVADLKSFFVLNDDIRKVSKETIESGALLPNVILTHDENTVEASMEGPISANTGVSRTITLTCKTNDIRLVLIDMGCKASDVVTASIRNTPLTETLVCQGKSEAVVALTFDTLDSLVASNIQVHGERIEIYTASGKELVSPVEIMEPLKFSLFLNTKVCGDLSDVEISFVTLSSLEVSVSMQNIALMQAILTSMSESFSLTIGTDTQHDEILTTIQTSQIEKLSRALENQEVLESESYQVAGFENSVRDVIVSNDQKYADDENKVVDRKLSIKMTLPDLSIVVINDLQGLDEALFKLFIQECVFMADTAKIRTSDPQSKDRRDFYRNLGKTSTLVFYIQMNTSLLADYFDTKRNSWEHLLLKPWEISIKATRGKSQRFTSRRMMTAIDVESHPCCVDFSEQLIISLGAASSMWAVYAGATRKAMVDGALPSDAASTDLQTPTKTDMANIKLMALNAARSLITTMPYALNNRCGLMVDYEIGDPQSRAQVKRYRSNPGTTEYFRFEPRKRVGTGGWRSYGQDVFHNKTVVLFIAGVTIRIEHIDKAVGLIRKAHDIGMGRYVFSQVIKNGKTTTLHLSSYVDIHNETSMSFNISVKDQTYERPIGTLQSRENSRKHRSIVSQSHKMTLATPADVIGIPVDLLISDSNQDEDLPLLFSTQLNGQNLTGYFQLPSLRVFHRLTIGGKNVHLFEISLSTDMDDSMTVMLPASKAVSVDLMVLCAFCKVSIVDDIHPLVEIYLRPRARLENKLNVDIILQTPMPHTYSGQQTEVENEMTLHSLSPFDSMEIFTRGPSVAVKIKLSPAPDAGDRTDWTSWIEIPLRLNQQRMRPVKGCFPFLGQDEVENSVCVGNMFFLSEDNYVDVTVSDDIDPGIRTLSLAAENLGIDHTRQILFQAYFPPDQQTRSSLSKRISNSVGQYFFSSFSSSDYKGKISFLPDSIVPLRIVSDSKKNHRRKTLPFMIDDIALCNGGLESSPLFWDDETPSGYFAYRKLSLNNQMELHVIPSFVIFNGGNDPVLVKMSHSEEIHLPPGDLAPLLHSDHRLGLIVQLFYPSLRLLTSPVRVESLGSKVSLTKKVPSGAAIGSVTLQTIIGVQDSCFVVNIGSIKYGGKSKPALSWLRDDFMRLRVRWSKIDITLNDTAHPVPLHDFTTGDNRKVKTKQLFAPVHYSVARIVMERFTVDFQRIFKVEEVLMDEKLSPERCQFSMLVKHVIITDCLSNTVVFQASNFLQSSSNNGNVFDLCIRTRGSEDSGITLVDLFDLKLSQASGLAVPLVIDTNESFLWSLIDIASRTKLAIGELSGVDIELTWDETNGEYSVVVMQVPVEERSSASAKSGVYRSPGNDRLISIRVASVSPVSLKLSFKRQPQKSRYSSSNQVAVGANLLHYFTTRLKFTIDNAEIRLPGFIEKQVKGSPDRIIDEIKAFYWSQLKFKLLGLVTATSLDDWKELTGREEGTEGYLEGDILRLTGNLAGRSASFLLKQVGSGLGSSVKVSSEAIGSGIQVMTEAIGVGAVGAGVNSVVSGFGDGLGKSVASIGAGTGKVLKGAGKGLGHIAGGVGGGIQQMAKGISKGVITGDPRLVAEGLGGGVMSVGVGLVEGADSMVTGAAEGVISAGKGLFEGVQSLGKGLGGIFNDSRHDKNKSKRRSGH